MAESAIRGLDLLLTSELADVAIPDAVPRFRLDRPCGNEDDDAAARAGLNGGVDDVHGLVAFGDELLSGVGSFDGVLVDHRAGSGGLADAARGTEESMMKNGGSLVSLAGAPPGQSSSEERQSAGEALASLSSAWACPLPLEGVNLQPETQRACAKEGELPTAVSLDPSLAVVAEMRATGWPAYELIGKYPSAVLLACGFDPDEVARAPDEACKASERWARWTFDVSLDSFSG